MKRKLDVEEDEGDVGVEVVSKGKKEKLVGEKLEKNREPEEIVEVEEEQMTVTEIDVNTATQATLLEHYTATLSEKDQRIFAKLRKDKTLELMPLFGPKRVEKASKASNPLLIHSGRANLLLDFLSSPQAFTTCFQYDPDVKTILNGKSRYDMRFLLPVLCNILDEKNIFDPIRVIKNGWIYFIIRGMSLDDEILRKISFLCFKRLIYNLQQPKLVKNLDVKMWLHFLHGIRRGISDMGDCKLSHLVSTWIVAAWEVIAEPSHEMYNKLTKFLLAKPVFEVTIIPEFLPFFNASDGDRITRDWILNILYWGLRDKDDWKLAQKLPIFKLLCSSFILEKQNSTRNNIVGVMILGANIPEVAQVMVEKYGILTWISNVVTKNLFLQNLLQKWFDAMKTNYPNANLNSARTSLFNYAEAKMKVNKEASAALKVDDPGELESNVDPQTSNS